MHAIAGRLTSRGIIVHSSIRVYLSTARISWYRKEFTVDAGWKGKNIWLDFSDYFLNGVWIGHHESGYTAFRWYLHNATGATLNYGPGATNILSVHVDALHFQEGWFYEGGGIYRHTKISAADPVSIMPWGVYAPSVIKPGGLPSTAAWTNLKLQMLPSSTSSPTFRPACRPRYDLCRP